MNLIRVKRHDGVVTEYAWDAEDFPPNIELLETRGEKLVKLRYTLLSRRQVEGGQWLGWYTLPTEVKK